MNDDRTTDPDVLDDDDQRDEAVIAADDTGMVSSERLIVQTEIEEGLEDPLGR